MFYIIIDLHIFPLYLHYICTYSLWGMNFTPLLRITGVGSGVGTLVVRRVSPTAACIVQSLVHHREYTAHAVNDSLLSSHSLYRLLLGVEQCLLYTLSLYLSHVASLLLSLPYSCIIHMRSHICTKDDFLTAKRRDWNLRWDDSNPKICWWPIYI